MGAGKNVGVGVICGCGSGKLFHWRNRERLLFGMMGPGVDMVVDRGDA